MRFFKLKNQYKTNFKDHWKETFDCAIEIVYTSSGFIIALLMNSAQLIPVIIVGYVIIIITASYLERAGSEEFKANTKFILNGLIILTIVSGTIWLMPSDTDINGHKREMISDLNDQDSTKLKPDSAMFYVVLPYIDESLEKHVGQTRFGDRLLFEQCTVKDIDKSSAILSAISKFQDSLKPLAMFVNKEDELSVKLINEKIICYEIVD